MAVKLEDKVNVEAPSTAFPYGNIKDNSGANDGTPVDKAVYADMHQFFERLMDVAGVTHNDLPESETNTFQYITALQSLISGFVQDKEYTEIPDIDISSTTIGVSITDLWTRVGFFKRGEECTILGFLRFDTDGSFTSSNSVRIILSNTGLVPLITGFAAVTAIEKLSSYEHIPAEIEIQPDMDMFIHAPVGSFLANRQYHIQIQITVRATV